MAQEWRTFSDETSSRIVISISNITQLSTSKNLRSPGFRSYLGTMYESKFKSLVCIFIASISLMAMVFTVMDEKLISCIM